MISGSSSRTGLPAFGVACPPQAWILRWGTFTRQLVLACQSVWHGGGFLICVIELGSLPFGLPRGPANA